MHVIYSQENAPEFMTKSLFLAGPSPRDKDHPNWRPEALKILEELGYDGVVFVPIPRDGKWPKTYSDQVDWEAKHLNMADLIVFWVPRDKEKLPALSTNTEFGMWNGTGKCVLGYPEDAPSMRYLQHLADMEKVPSFHSLPSMLGWVVNSLGAGSLRAGGQREVPLYIWNTPSFQAWLKAQEGAGNRLEGAKVVWTFRVGPEKTFVFFWALHVDVYIKEEDRHKTNEVVLGRPDISTIVAYQPIRAEDDDACAPHNAFMDTPIVLVREFRSPAVTPDGFIRELPGGSSWKPGENALVVASEELHEETGLKVDANRFKFVDARQVTGTLSSHFGHVFTVELTAEEMKTIRDEVGSGKTHGVTEDTEKTYVEMTTVRELIGPDNVDWANTGMILTALLR